MIFLSVIIPVKNGASTLANCLTAIKQQTIADKIEILVLDSASKDKSIEIAKSLGATIININPLDFNHGLTRNVGVNNASGELLYFTVQDAYLAEKDQLEKMVLHFTDLELQAVVGMQATPHEMNKNPARWFKRFTKPETAFRHFPDGSFGKMSLQQQFRFCSWDNVNAMYRKSALQKIPFIKTDFAEDWLWVKDALTAKMKIAFNPSLLVWHYHHRDFAYSFKVQYIVNYNFYRHFKVFPHLPSFFKPLLSTSYTLLKRKKLGLREKIYWIAHNFSGLAGGFLSHLIFIITGKVFGRTALDESYKKIISNIPQGKSKKAI